MILTKVAEWLVPDRTVQPRTRINFMMNTKNICYDEGRNTLRNRNEAARALLLPTLWPVRQSGAALEPNVIELTNLMTSHCFNPSRYHWLWRCWQYLRTVSCLCNDFFNVGIVWQLPDDQLMTDFYTKSLNAPYTIKSNCKKWGFSPRFLCIGRKIASFQIFSLAVLSSSLPSLT